MSDTPPRQYALVRLEDDYKKWLVENNHSDSPLLQTDTFVFLGEIPNMPDHCVVVNRKTGEVLSGYHCEDFVEIPQDET